MSFRREFWRAFVEVYNRGWTAVLVVLTLIGYSAAAALEYAEGEPAGYRALVWFLLILGNCWAVYFAGSRAWQKTYARLLELEQRGTCQ